MCPGTTAASGLSCARDNRNALPASTLLNSVTPYEEILRSSPSTDEERDPLGGQRTCLVPPSRRLGPKVPGELLTPKVGSDPARNAGLICQEVDGFPETNLLLKQNSPLRGLISPSSFYLFVF